MPISQIVGTELPALQFIDSRSAPKPPGEQPRFSDYLARQTDLTDRGPVQAERDRERQAPRPTEDPSYAAGATDSAAAAHVRVSEDARSTAGDPGQGKQSKIDTSRGAAPKAQSIREDPATHTARVDKRKASRWAAQVRPQTSSTASVGGERKARAGFVRSGEALSAKRAERSGVRSPAQVGHPGQNDEAQRAISERAARAAAENLAEHVADIDVMLSRAGRGEDGTSVHPRIRGNLDGVKRKAKGSAERAVAPTARRSGEGIAQTLVIEKRKVPLHVRDVRREKTGKPRRAESGTQPKGPIGTPEQRDGAGPERLPGELTRPADDAGTSMTGRTADNGAFTSRADGPAASARSATVTMHALRQALSDNVNAEIVRAARLVVRGADTGEIRLHLKPESLGNVRISLQMHEGHVAGRIIVENSSVREVFEQNLADLIRAFNESGLETGALDIALADPRDGSQTNGHGENKSRVVDAVRRLDHAVPRIDVLEDDHELVDLVV